MFVQIHMLQSMPPGNLNRDDTGQPKKCIFGGVTRGRISSQCLKHNIRHSIQFEEVFGDNRTVRTRYLPGMVAHELRALKPEISDDDLKKVKAALAKKFVKHEEGQTGPHEAGESEKDQGQSKSSSAVSDATDQTGQLVFFPPPFAREIAELIADLRNKENAVYSAWTSGKKNEKEKHKKRIGEFEREILKESESLTLDIGLFGRMTTSDLVVDVEAACQVAHAIATHETIIESDYFTAVDDKKQGTGAGYIGSGEHETFFNSAVYYKYLNLHLDALKKHLSWQDDEAARAAGVLLRAAALANPTGKQNSFAAHGVPELILVEVSKAKCPISYANAFLKPVDGLDLMTESAKALTDYVNTVAKAFAPADMTRALLAVGSASTDIEEAKRVHTLDALVNSVLELLKEGTP